jgi:hypothetical protein
MWKSAVLYGALLAVGTLALHWLDCQRLAHSAGSSSSGPTPGLGLGISLVATLFYVLA